MKTTVVLKITCEEVIGKGWVTHATNPPQKRFAATASGETWQEAYQNLFSLLLKYPEALEPQR